MKANVHIYFNLHNFVKKYLSTKVLAVLLPGQVYATLRRVSC